MKHNKLFLLVKTGLFNQWRLEEFRHAYDAKAKRRELFIGIGVLFISLVLITYSGGLAFGLTAIGLGKTVPAFALCAVSLITLVFTMLKTNGILFGYQDYDMLSALPVPTYFLIASRFLMMYIMSLFPSLAVMLPMGVVSGILQGASPVFYLFWLIGSLLAPLIPTTIAAFLGAAIMAVSSKMKHSGIFVTLISVVAVFGIFAAIFLLAGRAETMEISDLAAVGVMLEHVFIRIYPFSGMFADAVNYLNFGSFLLFFLCSAGWYALFTWFLTGRYKRIQSRLTARRTRSNYRLTHLTQASPFRALYRKEMRRFFSSSPYMLNLGIGMLMLIAFSVLILFFDTETILNQLNLPANIGKEMIANRISAVVPFAVSMLLGMSNTACVSLSLEGKNFWIVQSSPISAKQLFDSKIAVNLTLLIPSSLIASLLFSIRFAQSPVQVFEIFLFPLIYSVFTAVFGMYINIRIPNLNWESETALIKQSANSMAGMFCGLFFSVLGLVLACIAPVSLMPYVSPLYYLATLFITAVLYRKISFTNLYL